MSDMNDKIVIYKGRGSTEVRVRLDGENVWLNRGQIAELFGRDVKTIGKHISNALTEELRDFSVVAKFATTASDGKVYQVEHYGLDMILSVGYRVKSAEGVRFRIWANEVLKKYVIDGVAMNEGRLKELEVEKLRGVEGMMGVVSRLIASKELAAGEAGGVLEVLTRYARSWDVLEEYDSGRISFGRGRKDRWKLDVDYAFELIDKMREDIGASELFGKVRGGSFEGIAGAIYQTFGSKELYGTVAEKAANLLYLIIKDHPFYDGNKRIGAFLFIVFLTMNDFHLTENGECKISDRALVAIALLIAESKPGEKELIVALVGRLLEK